MRYGTFSRYTHVAYNDLEIPFTTEQKKNASLAILRPQGIISTIVLIFTRGSGPGFTSPTGSFRSSSRFFSFLGSTFSSRWERPPPTYDEAMKHVNPDIARDARSVHSTLRNTVCCMVLRRHWGILLCTGWVCRMSHRKWNYGPNGLHWPVMPKRPIIPFPVRHSESQCGTVLS